ncbi:MAG TPA: gliding motility lipoprotein GldH [Chitinophagaceae bacterium]|nr:gliding motility lipoprotein GldH [Chitinophagaceae bacterium]
MTLKKKYRIKICMLCFVAIHFVSCVKIDLYEKDVAIPSQQWFYNTTPSFTFDITDTASLYNLYIVLRHTDAYEYNNIWLRLGTKAPGDSMEYQNLNLSLASDAHGWEGTGTDDIFEVRKNITPGPVPFKRPGRYTFSVAQIMRENPLKHILNIGLRIEKVK